MSDQMPTKEQIAAMVEDGLFTPGCWLSPEIETDDAEQEAGRDRKGVHGDC